jgi:hypothetical protein
MPMPQFTLLWVDTILLRSAVTTRLHGLVLYLRHGVPEEDPLTIVMNWQAHKSIEWRGRSYGQKDFQFALPAIADAYDGSDRSCSCRKSRPAQGSCWPQLARGPGHWRDAHDRQLSRIYPLLAGRIRRLQACFPRDAQRLIERLLLTGSELHGVVADMAAEAIDRITGHSRRRPGSTRIRQIVLRARYCASKVPAGLGTRLR